VDIFPAGRAQAEQQAYEALEALRTDSDGNGDQDDFEL
jgi:hypothetical protein